MECLGIPIDHRVRRVIREARSMNTSVPDSKHLEPLYGLGTCLKINKEEYPMNDLSFGLEMARQESKGGVLIALLQPHSTQDDSNGFLVGRRNCKTLNAVSDLITAVNNAKVGFDDVSVFDATPLIIEAATGSEISTLIDRAHNAFADMNRAKTPDVVICCFKMESHNTLVQQFCGQGLGGSFNDDKSMPKPIESGLSFTRVNAFHPSYAINRYPIFCFFRPLLILEFTKAFGRNGLKSHG